MKMKKKPQFSDELLDQIIADDMLGGDWTPIQNKLDGIKAALMERMLRGEMTHHLGYPAGEDAPTGISNRRNGTSEKTLQTDSGEVTIQIPRDRMGDFDPIIVQKHQRRLPDFDEKVIALYARGLSTKDIQGYLYEIYKTEVSAELISSLRKKSWRNWRSGRTVPWKAITPSSISMAYGSKSAIVATFSAKLSISPLALIWMATKRSSVSGLPKAKAVNSGCPF